MSASLIIEHNGGLYSLTGRRFQSQEWSPFWSGWDALEGGLDGGLGVVRSDVALHHSQQTITLPGGMAVHVWTHWIANSLFFRSSLRPPEQLTPYSPKIVQALPLRTDYGDPERFSLAASALCTAQLINRWTGQCAPQAPASDRLFHRLALGTHHINLAAYFCSQGAGTSLILQSATSLVSLSESFDRVLDLVKIVWASQFLSFVVALHQTPCTLSCHRCPKSFDHLMHFPSPCR